MINAQNLENRTLSSYENKINTVITGNREQITIYKAEYDLLKNNINYSEEEKKLEIGQMVKKYMQKQF